MKIYIDADCLCHSSPAEGLREFDVPDFGGKCAALIEGYRYVPLGETWTRSDGIEFIGEMIAPFVDSRILEAYQQQYEAMLPEMTDMQTALETLGVTVDG
jgi:hypothetical protein